MLAGLLVGDLACGGRALEAQGPAPATAPAPDAATNAPPDASTASAPDVTTDSASAARPEIASDPFATAPRFGVELADEIALAGAPLNAEAVLVLKTKIVIHSRDGAFVFSPTGELFGAAQGSSGAMGSDTYYRPDGPIVLGIVIGPVLAWFDWEISASVLENIQYATGLGLGKNRDLCDGCVYITDGPGQSVKEYGAGGGPFGRELPLPDTDPQGVAVSASGQVYVVDAKHRRLLRADSRLQSVGAVADLPAGVGGRVPTGLSFDADGRLYVCFRDRNSLVVLDLPDGP
jgi:hypothetical protein